jgi:hypothetical protein
MTKMKIRTKPFQSIAVTYLTEFPIGARVALDGQEYELVGRRDYVTSAGATGYVNRWVSRCIDCLAPFEAGATAMTIAFSRRCQACRKPGARVSIAELNSYHERLAAEQEVAA